VAYSLVLKRNKARITSLSALRDEDDLKLVETSSLSPIKKQENAKTQSKDSDLDTEITTPESSTTTGESESPLSDTQTAIWQQKFRKMGRRCKNYTIESKSYSRPISIIEDYFFGKEPKAHPAIVATFVVLAQNFVPMTISQIIYEATVDGYLLKKDAHFDIFGSIQDEIESLKSKAFFTIVDNSKIGLSLYGQEVVDSIENLKFLIGLLCKKLNNHNVSIDVAKYCESSSSSNKNNDTRTDQKRKRTSETLKVPITVKKKKNSLKVPVPSPSLRNKSKLIREEEERSDYSNSSKDNTTQSVATRSASIHSNTSTDRIIVWINGIPSDWRDNFFVKKKVMKAITSRFDNISIISLTKDTQSELWKLTLSSNSDVQSMTGQSLDIIEEGNTTQHTLTFMISSH